MDQERKLEAAPLEGFDQRLAVALRDVPVPAGLSDRLLARLKAESAPSRADVLPLAETSAPVKRLVLNRRTWYGVAAGMSIAASLCLWWASSGTTQSPDAAELATTWNDALNNQSPSWAAMGSAPKGFGVPASVRVPAHSWTSLNKIVGRRGVAYNLGGAGRIAKLFVVRMPADVSLPSSPPASPQASTGGMTIGVWQSGGLRYVLVVTGDVRAYRELIESSHVPLAWVPSPKPRIFADRAAAL